jgi:two-component system, OmpR family, response regulator
MNDRPDTVRVLCVDDNTDTAFTTAKFLELVGYDIRFCMDGPSALEMAAAFRPHVCVLDITMPGMDGYQLARRLREMLGPVILVAMTASYGGEHDHLVGEAGFSQRLIKPTDPERLVAVLERLTRTKAALA